MLLNASLNNHRRNGAICESISSYLGKKKRLAYSSIPSNQAAMKKHHSIIIIDFWSLLDLIESSSLRSRSLLRKQRQAGWSFWSPQSLIKLHAIPSLLTWRYYYGRAVAVGGIGSRHRTLPVVAWTLSSIAKRYLWRKTIKCIFQSRMKHSGQMQGGRDLNKLCSAMGFRDYFGKAALYSLSYERSLPPSEKSILHNTYYM